MKRQLIRWSLLGLLGLLLMVGQPAARAQNPASEMLLLINQFRAQNGLLPFVSNGSLAAAAQTHANWMAANVIYSHTGAGGSTPQSRAEGAGYVGYVAENIVGGWKMSPRQGLVWWQNSPVHYNTLVSVRYTEAGTGYASNGEQNMYVLVAGRPSDAPPSSPSLGDVQPGPLIITPIELAEPRDDGAIVHVVQQGQALWSIAAYYDVDLDYLLLINNLRQDAFLQPGDEVYVRLPEGQGPPPTPTPPLTHVVRAGQTAWTIAALHAIELDYFYLLNGMDENSVLHPGDEVVVRLAEGQAPPPTSTPRSTHIVQSGETLWAIASLYGLALDDLLAFNGLASDAILQPGDELVIRPTAPPPTATATTEAAPAATTTPTPPPAETGAASPAQESAFIAAALSSDQGTSTPSAASDSISAAVPKSQEAAGDQGGTAGLLLAFAGLALAAAAMIIVARNRDVG